MLSEPEKAALKQQIRSNQHEVFIVSIKEMDAIVRSSPKSKQPRVQQAWQSIKSKAELSASYYASATDIRTIGKLVNDLGSPGARVYVKTYGGKPHIILKGHPGLRKILTGTKYGMANPKVVAMGLGKVAAGQAAKSGGLLTIVLLSGYRVVDYFLTDEATLSQLVGRLATDVVKVGISVGVSLAVASIVTGVAATLAIGPLAVVIGVGILASMALTAVDDHFGLTDKLISAIDELAADAHNSYSATKDDLEQKAMKIAGKAIDYVVNSTQKIIVDFARHQLRRVLPTAPRIGR